MKNVMKKALSLLLVVCLLLPTASLITWADNEITTYKKIADLPLSTSKQRTVTASGHLFEAYAVFDPIDLTQYGYPADDVIGSGVLGIQMDIAISGNDAVVEAVASGAGGGQFEISSAGWIDNEELCNTASSVMKWKANEWTRHTVDLSELAVATGDDAWDPTAFDCMRIYLDGLGVFAGQTCYVKIVNVQLVDLSATVPVEEAHALGNGTPGDQAPPTYKAAGYKELASIDYEVACFNGTVGGTFYGYKSFDPIDLTAFGYPTEGDIEAGYLGLQFDLYMDAGKEMAAALEGGAGSGQFEIASGGFCDIEELGKAPVFDWKNEAWTRNVVDFAWFTTVTHGPFDPTNFNWFRIYMDAPTDGKTYVLKMCNLRVVDLTQPLSEEEAPRVGDGMGKPSAPEYQVEEDAWDYNPDTAVVSGYNLVEYAQKNGLLPMKDWAPLAQMLLFSLAEKGGGVLYIPAGVYECRTNLVIPSGCVLQGDWVNPDESIDVRGTVLAVYANTSSAFITMGGASLVKSLAFWYPEQTVKRPQEYPYTILMDHDDTVENITLVNAYQGIYSPYPISCPNIENVYGTPLSVGIDMQSCSDQWEMENVHFAADYWVNSGLAGAPTTAEDKEELKNVLYYEGTGIILRRIDWSWVTYSSIKGYSVGLQMVPNGDYATNGMIHEVLFEDCYTAIYSEALAQRGVIVTSSTIRNCRYGVFVDNASDFTHGSLKMMDMDISATSEALTVNDMAQVSLLESVVRSGAVNISNGWFTLVGTVFYTDGAQVVLKKGTQVATVTDCVDYWGDAIEVDNQARCSLTVSDEPIDMDKIPTITPEEGGLAKKVGPASQDVTIADLDRTGKTDVSAELNALLEAQAATGGTVFLPAGLYRLDASVTVPSGVQLLGSQDVGHDVGGYNIGTVFQIYFGRGSEEGAVFYLEESAGLRGVKAIWPEQDYYTAGTFVPYPYFVQGQGSDVYVVNVSVQNAWAVMDLMTYRCDNHYIDAVRGGAFRNFLAIGKGAENGVVRNCHQQHSSFCGYQGELPTITHAFAGYNEDFFLIGDVENEIMVGNFAYAVGTGYKFVAEETGAADVTIYGCVIDYSTKVVEVEEAERVDIISLQATCMTPLRDMTAEMDHVHLHDTFDGEVNVWTGILYENSDYVFRADGGTLNVYSFTLASNSPVTNVSGDGKVNLYDGVYSIYYGFDGKDPVHTITTTAGEGKNVTMRLGYYLRNLNDTQKIGRYEGVSYVTNNWYYDVAEDMQVPEGSEVVFSDAFSDYNSMPDQWKMEFQNIGGGGVAVRRGVATLTAKGGAFLNAMRANSRFNLTAGAYRYEMRLNVESLRQEDGSRLSFATLGENGSSVECVRIAPDGSVQVRTASGGMESIGKISLGTWYRLSVTFDMDADTYTVVLYDDAYNVVAKSGTRPITINTFTGLWFGAETMPGDETQTVVQVDYMAVLTDGEPTQNATIGDINGDNKVDSTDARLILQYTVGKIGADVLNVVNGNVNGDDKVDSTDARLVLQYAVGKISQF